MTKHTWTNIVSALLFLACVAVMSFVPTPFVTWGAGTSYDLLGGPETKPMVRVTNTDTYPVTGQLRMTTVGVTPVDSRVNLVQVLMAYLTPAQDVLPRDVVYPPQLDQAAVAAQEAAQMSTSQSTSIVAALRAADVPVSELPMVVTVTASGAAAGRLQPGDLITTVDGAVVTTPAAVQDAIEANSVGDPIAIGYLRDSVSGTETITSRASAKQADVPAIGVTIGMGYVFVPRVEFGIDPEIGGPSAGLMFALAIYDKISPGDLAAGRIIAGTGTIDAHGGVGPIGGLQEKIAGAVRDHAEVFIMPRANCVDLTEPVGVQVIPVATLTEAVAALGTLANPTAPPPPGCT